MSMSDINFESVSAARKMISCSPSAVPSSSSNAQLRKIKKPLIERRRRERINECLGQLKALVLEATNKDESRYSKMEKADILEMTVAHLKLVHNAKRLHSESSRDGCSVLADGVDGAPATAVSVADDAASGTATLRYLMGYNECVREVASYLTADDGSMPRLGEDVRTALIRHLDDSLRLRACAPIVVGALRLPTSSSLADTTCMRLQIDAHESDPAACGRHLYGLQDVESMSPSSVEMAPDCAGASPRRPRCDSGVYSGASSPAQADELSGSAPAAAVTSFPLELTTRSRDTATTTTTMKSVVFPDNQLPQPVQTLDCSMTAEPWRPW